MRPRARSIPAQLILIFLIIFPKAGIKILDLPLTFGYLLVGMAFLVRLPSSLYGLLTVGLSRARITALLLLLPFQLYAIVLLIGVGYEDIGNTIALIVGMVFLPWAFIFVLSSDIIKFDIDYFLKFVYLSVVIVSIYGIFLFLYRIIFDYYIEIPFLTVNYDDVGLLETKHNDRGGVYKLISTYNNGNIFGVAILMLLPIVQLQSRNVFLLLIVKVALLLTLSRTVWFGLIVHEVLVFFGQKKISIKRVFAVLAALLFLSVSIFYVADSLGWSVERVFDTNLGGRIQQVIDALHGDFIPKDPYSGIGEMVFMGIINGFGYLGLLLFIVGFVSPVFLYFFQGPRGDDRFDAIMKGIIIYLLVSQIDGAFLLIPILAIYWLLISVLLIPRKRIRCNDLSLNGH